MSNFIEKKEDEIFWWLSNRKHSRDFYYKSLIRDQKVTDSNGLMLLFLPTDVSEEYLVEVNLYLSQSSWY